MKKARNFILYFLFFIINVLIFLYFIFPYNLLKDIVISNLEDQIGYVFEIKNMKRLNLKDINIKNPFTEASLKIKEIKLDLGLLYLFLNKINVNVRIKDYKNGYINIFLSLPFSEIISGNLKTLNYIDIKSKKFDIGNIIAFIINIYSSSKSIDPMIAEFIKDIKIKGNLDGEVLFKYNDKNITNSKTNIDLKFKNLELDIVNKDLKDLGLEKQIFKKARLMVTSNSDEVQMKKGSSNIISQDLELKTWGKAKLNKNILKSKINLDLNLVLKGGYKENLGSLLQTALELSSDDRLNMRFIYDKGRSYVNFY